MDNDPIWRIPKGYRIKLKELVDSVLKLSRSIDAWEDFYDELNEQAARLRKKCDSTWMMIAATEAQSGD